jgi:hypothetical protein
LSRFLKASQQNFSADGLTIIIMLTANDDASDEAALDTCMLLLLVSMHNIQRNRHKLCHPAILPPHTSPRAHLLDFADPASFLDITGFTRASFMQLETVLVTAYHPPSLGRPSLLDFRGRVGLYLFYVGSRMQIKFLCLLFGIVSSCASEYIQRMQKIVVRALKHHPASRIAWPGLDNKQRFAAMVAAREPQARNSSRSTGV